LVPPDLTLAASAAPPVTLRLVLIGLAVGSALLAPSLWYLFRLFKGERKPLPQ
jgi:cytochrome d ubiquinol oxidase subunit II